MYIATEYITTHSFTFGVTDSSIKNLAAPRLNINHKLIDAFCVLPRLKSSSEVQDSTSARIQLFFSSSSSLVLLILAL